MTLLPAKLPTSLFILGLGALALPLLAACSSGGADSDTTSESGNLESVVADENLNRCEEEDKCVELNTYAATNDRPDLARTIGTFILTGSDGPHKSPFCELTLRGTSNYDEKLQANRIEGRTYRAIKCGTKEEERGTYKIFQGSLSQQFIEFRSEKGAAYYYGLNQNPARADIALNYWYYESEEKQAKGQPKFDAFSFVRDGQFWCASVADCEGQYLGCFTPRSSGEGGGVRCENGPPWKCERSKCIGIAAKP